MLNFELTTELQLVHRRDFAVANNAQINPTNANPIIDGEFMEIDSAYKLIRAGNGKAAFAVFAERGRYDVQAIKKLTVLFGNSYEADTRVFTSAGLVLGGNLQTSNAVTVDAQTKSGLLVWASGPVIGFVTRLPATNGGRLRFFQTLV
jgi:hypothetical protein